jgi:hypothetical protein
MCITLETKNPSPLNTLDKVSRRFWDRYQFLSCAGLLGTVEPGWGFRPAPLYSSAPEGDGIGSVHANDKTVMAYQCVAFAV